MRTTNIYESCYEKKLHEIGVFLCSYENGIGFIGYPKLLAVKTVNAVPNGNQSQRAEGLEETFWRIPESL